MPSSNASGGRARTTGASSPGRRRENQQLVLLLVIRRKCNFPLQGIVNKKVAVLQDLRPQSVRIALDSLLVLLEGQHVAAPMPRNVNTEDVTWSAKGMPFLNQRI